MKKSPLMMKFKEGMNKLLIRAGMEKKASSYMLKIFFVALVLSLIALFFIRGSLGGALNFLLFFLLFLVGGLIVFGLFFYGIVTLKIYQRKKKIEDILADYLQLVAANVSAGMPIDQAMWYAVRERFGILAQEIENVAKKVMSGHELSEALRAFAQKYDSHVLTQTMTLLIEGLESGGEIAVLIANIAWNIREGQIMKQEISADIMSYVIFISFASLLAAPLLFGLSLKLVGIMTSVIGGIDISGAATVGSILSFQSSEGVLDPNDFKIFALVCLGITGTFSSLILSTIRTGGLKDSVKYIPFFLAIVYGLFFIISAVLNVLFANFINIV